MKSILKKSRLSSMTFSVPCREAPRTVSGAGWPLHGRHRRLAVFHFREYLLSGVPHQGRQERNVRYSHHGRAAGTGAQEVMCLLDRWGIGVSQVIGVGGRDLSAAVGGTMACEAVHALDASPAPSSSCWSPNPPTPRWPGR